MFSDQTVKPEEPHNTTAVISAKRVYHTWGEKCSYNAKERNVSRWTTEGMVGAPGFEPGASCAQGRRATRLRYAPT